MTDVAMAPINGVVSPQSQQQHDLPQSSLNGPAKRKRVDSNEAAVHMNGTIALKADEVPNANIQEQIADFITVLKKYICHH